MNKPFWENTYKHKEYSTFGEPSIEVKQIAQRLKKSSKILDIGCGEGRHSIFLASLGFHVDAFDISENGINKLKHIVKEKKLDINAKISSITDYEFSNRYDFIIAHGVLHLIKREDWEPLIDKMKMYTNLNGVNVIVVFIDKIPIPEDLREFCIGLFKDGEIKQIYNDWEIELYKSYIFQDEHPGSIKHTHAVNKLVAWKRKV